MFWDGFTARFGVFFAPFRPDFGDVPTGMVALLLHRAAVGTVVGAFGGEAKQVQVAQVTVLLGLYAALGAYLILARPFVRAATNVAEATVALCVTAFLAVVLFALPEAEARG